MRYLLFVFPAFEPAGGWNDYAGAFEDKQQARDETDRLAESEDRIVEGGHIVDLESGEIVSHFQRKLGNGPGVPDGPIEWKEGTPQ